MANVALPSRADAPITTEGAPTRWILTAFTIGFLALFLLAPLIVVAVEAFSKGWEAYLAALIEPDALQSILLTLIVAVIVVPINGKRYEHTRACPGCSGDYATRANRLGIQNWRMASTTVGMARHAS
jgi:hypothetical protein